MRLDCLGDLGSMKPRFVTDRTVKNPGLFGGKCIGGIASDLPLLDWPRVSLEKPTESTGHVYFSRVCRASFDWSGGLGGRLHPPRARQHSGLAAEVGSSSSQCGGWDGMVLNQTRVIP